MGELPIPTESPLKPLTLGAKPFGAPFLNSSAQTSLIPKLEARWAVKVSPKGETTVTEDNCKIWWGKVG